jgi:hypothetical protein
MEPYGKGAARSGAAADPRYELAEAGFSHRPGAFMGMIFRGGEGKLNKVGQSWVWEPGRRPLSKEERWKNKPFD